MTSKNIRRDHKLYGRREVWPFTGLCPKTTVLSLLSYFKIHDLGVGDPCKLRGPGGVFDLGMGKIEFDAVFDRGKCKLPDAFYGIKKNCS